MAARIALEIVLATTAAVIGVTPESLLFIFVRSADVGIEVILALRG